MKLESLNERAASNLSSRHVSGRCLCGAVELEIDFPAFGPGTITPRRAVARTAQRMRPISVVGASVPAWRRAEEASLASRMQRRSRPEASAPGAVRRCSTSASARRTWSISRGHSSPAVPAASPAITWPSRSFRIGPTQAPSLSPLRAIPVSSGNARNRAGARATLMPRVPRPARPVRAYSQRPVKASASPRFEICLGK